MERQELLEVIRAGLKRMEAAVQAKKDTELPIFEVRPIMNGFIVFYNDVEEYDVTIPAYAPPGQNPLNPPGAPKMEQQRRYRMKRAEVYCADADAIKRAVEESLKLEEKVRLLIAEGVLRGDHNPDHDTAVGAF